MFFAFSFDSLHAGFLAFFLWLFFFVFFSKILSLFSLFRKGISWLLGFCLSTIFILSNAQRKITNYLISKFNFTVAVIFILFFFVIAYIVTSILEIKIKKKEVLEKKRKKEIGEKLVEKFGEELEK